MHRRLFRLAHRLVATRPLSAVLRRPVPIRCLQVAVMSIMVLGLGCWVVDPGNPVDEAGLSTQPSTLELPDGSREVTTAAVEVDELERRGGAARLGRLFLAQDRGAAIGAIVLSRELWESAFDGDPQIIGRALPLAGSPKVVIGILDGPSGAVDVFTVTGRGPTTEPPAGDPAAGTAAVG